MNNQLPPHHQTCLSYRIMMSLILTFLALSLKKKKKEKKASDKWSCICIFRSVFSGSAFLFMVFLITVFPNFLFPSKLYINSFCLSWSHVGLNFSPLWRSVLLGRLLMHRAHEGHSYSKCFDKLQLFALKRLSRGVELHTLPAKWHYSNHTDNTQ